MNIRETDFVLEIGSGHSPKTRSDILCDKFIEDDIQRGGEIVTDRPIIAADAQYLPFTDKSFDYIITSHVMEHVENPELFIKELMRVGYRGHIETPSEIAEMLYGWPYHNWLISLIGGKLVIRKKVNDSQFGQLFHSLAAHDKDFARFHTKYHRILLVQYEWDGKINYEIQPPDSSPLNLNSIQEVEALLARKAEESFIDELKQTIKNALPNWLRNKIKSTVVKHKKAPKRTLREIVVCPACKGGLKWQTDEILCHECNVSYPIKNGIPYLLIQESQ